MTMYVKVTYLNDKGEARSDMMMLEKNACKIISMEALDFSHLRETVVARMEMT